MASCPECYRSVAKLNFFAAKTRTAHVYRPYHPALAIWTAFRQQATCDGSSGGVHIVSLFIFVVLQVPTALVKNLGALIPLRFLAGFVGSFALAIGGASLIDMWSPGNWAIVLGLWSLAAVCGPQCAPENSAAYTT